MIEPVVNVRCLIAATTAEATSSGAARRFSGVRPTCSASQALSIDRTKSFSTRPGETDTTRIFGARARASDLVMLSTAAFDAQYITLLPIAVTPAIDEILITTAPPSWLLFSSNGRSARTAANGPRTLVER